jgi:hypothetical protein
MARRRIYPGRVLGRRILGRARFRLARAAVSEAVPIGWPEVPGATRYRVLVRDETTGEDILRSETEKPRYAVPPGRLDRNRRYHWRAQAREGDARRWVDVLPPLRLPLPPPEGAAVTPLEWPNAGAPAYRVVIRDETADEIVIKDGVRGTRYLVNWAELDPGHRYRFRVQTWSGDGWADGTPYRQLSPPLSLVRSVVARVEERADAGQDAGELLFLFTCDTEINLRRMRNPDLSKGIEHQIFCLHDGRDYGIGYLMDALDRYDFKGTFFLDVLLEHQFGAGCLEPIVAAIQERGHDVQIHLHPWPHLRLSGNESLRRLSTGIDESDPDKFRGALAVAMELFEKRVGALPVAYRSGAYRLCDEFFPVLSEFGIKIDSSLYPFKNCRVSPWMRARTQPFFVGDVLEVPVSWILDHRAAEKRQQQFAPFKGDRGQQQAFTSMRGPAGGPPATLVYLAHSYSMLSRHPSDDDRMREKWNSELKAGSTDHQYANLHMPERTPVMFFGDPDEDRMLILERGLAELAARGDVKGVTLRELSSYDLRQWSRWPAPADPLPEWHQVAGRVHTTGTRRYSASYLAHLEAEARERAAGRPAR